MFSNIPFTTQSNADASKMFQAKKEGQKNILVSDFRIMLARQISKVQLHR